jgi:hypothetical protein
MAFGRPVEIWPIERRDSGGGGDGGGKRRRRTADMTDGKAEEKKEGKRTCDGRGFEIHVASDFKLSLVLVILTVIIC